MNSFSQVPIILYDDDHLLVINKPSGLTVNKSDTTANEVTIQDWVEEHQLSLRFACKGDKGNDSDFCKRAGIVHRLDKETSGILLIAKTPQAFENLQNQFKERIVEKSYRALVHGVIIPSEGEINVPVGRLEFNRKRFGIVAGGREAVTKYRVVSSKYLISGKSKESLSFVELYPKTGRTHQIRVHLKYLNHPVFSDLLYAGRKTARNDRKSLARLFLHAAKITFRHPIKNENLTLESPLPEELKNFIESLSAE